MYTCIVYVFEYVGIDLNCAYENHLRFPISLFLRPTPPPAVFIVIMAFDSKTLSFAINGFKDGEISFSTVRLCAYKKCCIKSRVVLIN